MMSASLELLQAASTIALSNLRLGSNIPGVSENTNCASLWIQIPLITDRVVWTFRVTIVIFWPIKWFIKVDFPEFGDPMTAISPALFSSNILAL